MKMDITVTGGPELVRRLESLIGGTAGELLESAVVSGALIVVNDAKRRAPVLTGNLRRSIHVGGHGHGGGLESGGGDTGTDIEGNSHSNHSAEVQVGTNVDYAAAQEYGTSRGIRAHPYLRPAFDENTDKVADEIKAAVRAQLANL
jgi:HK97 gp10 family phage protein